MTLKFMCLNLWSEGGILDKATAYINQEKPDILAVQEVWHSKNKSINTNYRAFQTVKDLCGFSYTSFAEAFTDNNGGHRFPTGNAIYSHWPITEHEPLFYDTPKGERYAQTHGEYSVTPRNLQFVTANTGKTKINIFNTQGVWDLNGDKATERRVKMYNEIAKATKNKQNVILAGDFNLKPTNMALAPIDAQLTSVFKNERSTSFNLRRKDLDKYPGYATAVVDLMYVSAEIKVLSYSCPDVDVSDHLPLVAKLEIQ
jgi:endonuclease/exonuclease/phosphatase family metal-dependent hydrolase